MKRIGYTVRFRSIYTNGKHVLEMMDEELRVMKRPAAQKLFNRYKGNRDVLDVELLPVFVGDKLDSHSK